MSTEALGPSKPEQVGNEEERTLFPQQRLLEAVFNTLRRPISPEKGEKLAETVSEVLTSTLRPREAELIIHRFGLADGRVQTLNEIGKDYGLTKERIRQIEEHALRKLRSPKIRDRLKEYLVLPEGSVAFSIAGLQDITEGDLESLTNVPFSELGIAAPLAQYVVRQTARFGFGSEENVATLLRENADPFLRYLSAEQLKHLGAELREVYERAKAGFYKKPEVINNRFLPDLKIKPDVLTLIASRPIESLNLWASTAGDLKRHSITTIGELLNRPQPGFLHDSWIAKMVERSLKTYIEAAEFEINPINRFLPKLEVSKETLASIATVWIYKIVGPRVMNALAHGDIYIVAQVLERAKEELLGIKQFGPKCLNELEAAIIRLTTSPLPLSPS